MKRKSKRSLALLLTGALLAGFLPTGTGAKSRAAEQPTLQNPRILKTTQEVAPGSAGKKELKNPTTQNGITTWDCIWFGNYWQEDTNGDGKADKNDEKTPIKWRVLSVEGDDVFLLADKNLDAQSYNDTEMSVTWETCTMRSWLNGYGAETNACGKDYRTENFMDYAFTAEEKAAVKTTTLANNDNPEYETAGGNNTSDQVYLLSIDEVKNLLYGFSEGDTDVDYCKRLSVNTAYTAAGGEIQSENMVSAGEEDAWWLRSSGYDSTTASYIYYDGSIDKHGDKGNFHYATRPALHLNLASDISWSYAGSTASDDGVATWDCIWFGNYWQEDTNGDGKADKEDDKTPIKWRVLSVKGDDAFLMADKNLDCQKYNDSKSEVTWETCTMRSWLNGYGAGLNQEGKDYSGNSFLNNAFTTLEQQGIKTTTVVNNDNLEYSTEAGNDTYDQVYLLSIDEVTDAAYGFSTYLGTSNKRKAENTMYVTEGGEIQVGPMFGSESMWWLRSPGGVNDCASLMFSEGTVNTYGYGVDNDVDGLAVRPALHLNLSSDSGWSYAGTVTSDGRIKEHESPKPTVSPSPTEPGKTAGPDSTEKPLVTPAVSERPSTPESTQKPLETTAPGTPSQPDHSFVAPSKPQPDSSANPVPGITFDPGKAAVGKVSALKLRQKKQTVTASWKKLTGAKGYQICYSTSKKWKNKKQKLINKNKAVIKNLKKKKTYYFRVRAYCLEGTKKVYGAWSSVKKIKTKK